MMTTVDTVVGICTTVSSPSFHRIQTLERGFNIWACNIWEHWMNNARTIFVALGFTIKRLCLKSWQCALQKAREVERSIH